MKQRTRNKNNRLYADYGGRGIGMCDAWFNSFPDFALDVITLPGYSPSLSIDRIKNDKGYEPGNIRWATMIEQARNRRSTRYIEFRGARKCLQEWSNELGIHPAALSARLDRWKDVQRSFTEPPRKDHRREKP